MQRELNAHEYRGVTILPTSSVHAQGRWYIQAIHRPTGIPYSEDHCRHCQTLAEARREIDMDHEFKATEI